MTGERIEIALAVGDGNRRIGFKPPLSDEQLKSLPQAYLLGRLTIAADTHHQEKKRDPCD